MSFDHTEWLNQFKTASLNGAGFKELRAKIFKETVEIVQAGGYTVDREFIEISNDGIPEHTEFFDAPQKLISSASDFKTVISVVERDCLETAGAALKKGYNPCVLNMANRQKPGGGVLEGAGAQEENLFRRSNLFLSLYQFAPFAGKYGIKKHQKQYPLNRDSGGIYSGGITVFRGAEDKGYCLITEPYKMSFVSVPAINTPELKKINDRYYIADHLVESTKEKIRTILRIAGTYHHDYLVLGAFGCGAFRNPPEHMAELFKEVFAEKEFLNRFKGIVFSIIDNHNSRMEHNPEGNVAPFARVFGGT
jgi:uncharacterized protein (TIGR02452 family)